MGWHIAAKRTKVEANWRWHRGLYHFLGYEKDWWEELDHPNFVGWHWGMEQELSSEDLELGIHNSCETSSLVSERTSHLKMDRRPPFYNPDHSREIVRKQGTELSERTAMMQQDLFKKMAVEEYESVLVLATELNIRPPPGFEEGRLPPGFQTIIPQLQGISAQAFNPGAGSVTIQSRPFAALNIPHQDSTIAQQRQVLAQAIASPNPTFAPISENLALPSWLPQPPPGLVQPQISNQLQTPSDFHPGRGTMVTPVPPPKQPRVRSLSPEDIGRLVEQARRRNAARDGTPPRINSPQVPQIVIGNADSALALAVPQYAQRGAMNHVEPPPGLGLAPAHSGQHQVVRSRQIDRVLGYELGLDSNMPSQVPRNPQEAAASAARHSQRIRSMQYSLAADPNIMVRQHSGPSTQLTAAGLPLTQRFTTLPSVLNPYSRMPLMTYKDALQAIIAETGPIHLLLRLTLLEPAPVTVLIYDDMNRALGVSEELVLTKEVDLRALVCLTQQLLDTTLTNLPGHDGQRYIIQSMDIRNGSDEMKAGHPPLKGECRGGDKVKSATWVRWIFGGDMEQYWQALRIEFQMGAPQPGDNKPVVKPIFRVKTVRQVALSDGSYFQGGHQFIELSSFQPSSSASQDVDLGRKDGGSDNGSYDNQNADPNQNSGQRQHGGGGAASSSSGPANTGSSNKGGNPGDNKMSFGGDAAASVSGSTNDGSGNNNNSGDKAPESSQANANSKTNPVDPTRNWGYYQRMGGDPRMHKLYDLSHVPFEVKDFPVPELQFDAAAEQELVARVQAEAWNFQEPRTSATPNASAQPTYSREKQAWFDKANQQLERAKGFEDDDSFFPNYDTQIAEARKIGAAHLIGGRQQNTTGNERIMPGDNSMRHGDTCAARTEVESYDAKGKGRATQTVSDTSHVDSGAVDASQAHIDRIISKFAGASKKPNLRQSPMGANTHKGAKMNVHAPDFNYQQLVDRSNNLSLSPYPQSLASPQSAYAQQSPYGMVGQVGSSGAGPQTLSPTMTDNQASSIHKSNSPVAFTTFSIPTLQPEQNNLSIGYAGSSGSGSPEKMSAGVSLSTRQSPQYTHQSRAHGQRIRSPERLNPAGYGHIPQLQYPSPEPTQQVHGMGFQQSHGQPSVDEPFYTQQGSGAGFQNGQQAQYNFNFEQPYGQGSGYNGGPGQM